MNGCKVRIGVDLWPGCGRSHILPQAVTNFLSNNGYVCLSQVTDPLTTKICHQGWHTTQQLGLDGDHVISWAHYTSALSSSHIWLLDKEDELVLDSNPSGAYTPKGGYVQLNSDLLRREPNWWWMRLWKHKCPSKSLVLMWCVLENILPTWDNLQ